MSQSTHIYKYRKSDDVLDGGLKLAEIVISSTGTKGFLDEEHICDAETFEEAVAALKRSCSDLPERIGQWKHIELKGIRQ